MRELAPETITDAVLEQMGTTADPRQKWIIAPGVQYLCSFAGSVGQAGADGFNDIQESATEVDYRGVFATDADGRSHLRTVKPIGYSIPMDGPVGVLVKSQGRHGMRPAHIHFLVGAPGYRELVTALYLRDDPHLADDVVFGSSGDLAVDIVEADPNCPIKGLPSIRFDLKLARESAADRVSGRVGSDPAAI